MVFGSIAQAGFNNEASSPFAISALEDCENVENIEGKEQVKAVKQEDTNWPTQFWSSDLNTVNCIEEPCCFFPYSILFQETTVFTLSDGKLFLNPKDTTDYVENVVSANTSEQSCHYVDVQGNCYAKTTNPSLCCGARQIKDNLFAYNFKFNVAQVACGEGHVMLIDVDDYLYALGNNNKGQLGLGDTHNRYTPELVIHSVYDVVCGGYCTFVIATDGTTFSMGDNKFLQLGLNHSNNPLKPEEITNLAEIKEIVCARSFTVFRDDDGIWFCGREDRCSPFGRRPSRSQQWSQLVKSASIVQVALSSSAVFWLDCKGQVSKMRLEDINKEILTASQLETNQIQAVYGSSFQSSILAVRFSGDIVRLEYEEPAGAMLSCPTFIPPVISLEYSRQLP